VGFRFAHECAQIHFEQSTFILYNIDMMQTLFHLEKDILGLEINPAKHIRRYRVVMYSDCDDNLIAREVKGQQDELEALCSLKRASSTVDFIIILHSSWEEQEIPVPVRLHALLTDMTHLVLIIFNLKRRKESFTMKIKEFENACTADDRDITGIWHGIHGASNQQNSSLSSHSYNENDENGEALMQRLKNWKNALGEWIQSRIIREQQY